MRDRISGKDSVPKKAAASLAQTTMRSLPPVIWAFARCWKKRTYWRNKECLLARTIRLVPAIRGFRLQLGLLPLHYSPRTLLVLYSYSPRTLLVLYITLLVLSSDSTLLSSYTLLVLPSYSTVLSSYSTRTPLVLYSTLLVLSSYSTLLSSYPPQILHYSPRILYSYSPRTLQYSPRTLLVLPSYSTVLSSYSTRTLLIYSTLYSPRPRTLLVLYIEYEESTRRVM